MSEYGQELEADCRGAKRHGGHCWPITTVGPAEQWGFSASMTDGDMTHGACIYCGKCDCGAFWATPTAALPLDEEAPA